MHSFVRRMPVVLAAVVIAISCDAALAPGKALPASDSYEALFLRVLRNPADAALNEEFARAAEARGDLRHAFAALERAVVSNPDDYEAQAEFDRVRTKLTPSVSRITVEVGANYASNPRQKPNTSSIINNVNPLEPRAPFPVRVPDDGVFDGRIAGADDRTIGSIRWRTLALAQGQIQANVSALNTEMLAVQSGPVFQLTPDIWMHVTGGGAVTWLNDDNLYNDASVGATIGGLYRGLTQTLTVSYTWRSADLGPSTLLSDPNIILADLNPNDAQIFDLEAHLIISPSLTPGDLLYFTPRVQVSNNDGNPSGSVMLVYPYDEPMRFNRPLYPSDFTEIGGALSYYFPVMSGRALLGAGIEVYHRWYDEAANTDSSVGGDCGDTSCMIDLASGNRRDTYIEPSVHAIFPNALAPGVDVNIDYRFEYNISNASTTVFREQAGAIVEIPDDFQNHVAGIHVVGRF